MPQPLTYKGKAAMFAAMVELFSRFGGDFLKIGSYRAAHRFGRAGFVLCACPLCRARKDAKYHFRVGWFSCGDCGFWGDTVDLLAKLEGIDRRAARRLFIRLFGFTPARLTYWTGLDWYDGRPLNRSSRMGA